MDMRAGRREHALKLFDDLRNDGATIPGIRKVTLVRAVAAAEGQNEKAIAILDEARAQHPAAADLARIEVLQGELLFGAKNSNRRPIGSRKRPERRRRPVAGPARLQCIVRLARTGKAGTVYQGTGTTWKNTARILIR